VLPAWQADWLKFGFLLSVFYLTVWLGVGGVWWKAIGLW
jgi:di/tricarboxylate transporter